MAAPAHVASLSTDATYATTGDAVTFAFDAGSASNRLLGIRSSWRDVGGHTIGDTAVTYNAIALSVAQAQVSGTANRAKMWYIHGPASGSNTVSVDPSTGSAEALATIDCYVYDNVDSGTPIDNVTNAQGTDTTAELTQTSAAGDTPLFTVGMRGSAPVSIAPTLYTGRLDNVNSQVMSGGGEGTGDTSVAFVGTITATTVSGWITIGFNMNAAASNAITASASGTSTVALTANAKRQASPGTVPGVSTVAAGLSAIRVISVTAAGLSTAVATLAAMRVLAATSAGTSTAAAALGAMRVVGLGAVGGTSTVSVSIYAARAIVVTVAGTSTVASPLNAMRAITATAAGTGAATASLSAGSGSSSSATAGKYAVEHASALLDVGAVESGDFSSDHSGAWRDVSEAGT